MLNSLGRSQEEGLDCAACLASLPPAQTAPDRCPPRTAADDAEAERAALWGGKEPRALWNATVLLWDEDAGVRTLELGLAQADWDWLMRVLLACAQHATSVALLKQHAASEWCC